MFKKKLFNKFLLLLLFIGLLLVFSNKVSAFDIDPSMFKDSSIDQIANKIPVEYVSEQPTVDTEYGTGSYKKTVEDGKITTTVYPIGGTGGIPVQTVNDPTKYPLQYTLQGTETTTNAVVLDANNLPTDLPEGATGLMSTYKDNETGELVSTVKIVSSSLPSGSTGTIPSTGFLPDCTTTPVYTDACTACEPGGDDQCGTFESTKTCTLTRIKILFFLSRLCTPKTITEPCTITNKECVDTTKVCVNNQCVDPNPTTTTTSTTTSSTTTTTGSSTTSSTTTTTVPTNCPDGEINPHFVCQSNGCAQINSCGVNSGGCTQSGGICGLEDGHTYLSLIIGLDGIGSTGDNQNPEDVNCTPEQRENQQCGSNWSPLKTNRDVVVELFTDSETSVSTYSSEINFTPGATNSGKFTGAVDLGTSFTGGSYVIKAKSSGYLKREFPYIQSITVAQTDEPYVVNTLPGIRLVTANVNQDTSLDIRDYNLLMSCSIFTTDNYAACNQNDNYKIWSDLEDNGEINQLDYNLLMREWVNQHEE